MSVSVSAKGGEGEGIYSFTSGRNSKRYASTQNCEVYCASPQTKESSGGSEKTSTHHCSQQQHLFGWIGTSTSSKTEVVRLPTSSEEINKSRSISCLCSSLAAQRQKTDGSHVPSCVSGQCTEKMHFHQRNELSPGDPRYTNDFAAPFIQQPSHRLSSLDVGSRALEGNDDRASWNREEADWFFHPTFGRSSNLEVSNGNTKRVCESTVYKDACVADSERSTRATSSTSGKACSTTRLEDHIGSLRDVKGLNTLSVSAHTLNGLTLTVNPHTVNTQGTTTSEKAAVDPAVLGSHTHGPIGANVFVFHIPHTWSAEDLAAHFGVHGRIVSARISTDRSGRPLGFGFVSFEQVSAAAAAVRSLNGYNVEGKRLKVSIKRGEQAALARNKFLSAPTVTPPPHFAEDSLEEADSVSARSPSAHSPSTQVPSVHVPSVHVPSVHAPSVHALTPLSRAGTPSGSSTNLFRPHDATPALETNCSTMPRERQPQHYAQGLHEQSQQGQSQPGQSQHRQSQHGHGHEPGHGPGHGQQAPGRHHPEQTTDTHGHENDTHGHQHEIHGHGHQHEIHGHSGDEEENQVLGILIELSLNVLMTQSEGEPLEAYESLLQVTKLNAGLSSLAKLVKVTMNLHSSLPVRNSSFS